MDLCSNISVWFQKIPTSLLQKEYYIELYCLLCLLFKMVFILVQTIFKNTFLIHFIVLEKQTKSKSHFVSTKNANEKWNGYYVKRK